VTLHLSNDTQEVCAEVQMREAFISAETTTYEGLRLRVGDGTAI
jgi:hypothetical protein